MNTHEDYNKWFPYYEFPSRYEINKKGQVRNIQLDKILTGSIRKSDGYLYYGLKDDNGKTITRAAHIMVAKQFIPHEEEKCLVNHIDENRGNSCVDNLEWVTPSENSKHGTAQKRKSNKIQKPVNEYNQDGKYIRTWKSIRCIVEFIEGKRINNTRENKAYNRIRVIAEKNAKEKKKRLVYGRIFVTVINDIDTSDLLCFELAIDKGNQIDKRKDILNDTQTVPEEFLYSCQTYGQKMIEKLQEICSRLSTHESDKEAINYAIGLIEKYESIDEYMKVIRTFDEYNILESKYKIYQLNKYKNNQKR